MHPRSQARQALFLLMVGAILFNTLFPVSARAAGRLAPQALAPAETSGTGQPAAFPSLEADAANVSILDDQFLPATITVTAGTTVTWTANGTSPTRVRSGAPLYSLFLPLIARQWEHAALSRPQGPASPLGPGGPDDWDSGTLAHGQAFGRRFDSAGTFPYYDTYAPHITGTIVVLPALTLGATPLITITSPLQGSLWGDGEVLVTGQVTGDGPLATVLVNDTPALLTGHTFQASVPVEDGNQTLYAAARDEGGNWGTDSVVVRVDGEPPLVSIHSPRDQEALYTIHPNVTISYTDFYTGVLPATFRAFLGDESGAQSDVSASFLAGPAGASGSLDLPLEDRVYTLTVSIADAYGHHGTDRHTVYLPPHPEEIVPPLATAQSGWVSGRVYNSATCDDDLITCQGLRGVAVTLALIDHESRTLSTPLSATLVTGPQGFYAFPVEATGTYALRFEKDGYTYGQREVAAIRQRSTAVSPVYLTPLDSAATPCDTAGCTHTSADGRLRVEIPAGAILEGQAVTVTATNFEHVEFLPVGSLPPGTWETYAFNLSGASEIQFTRPITVMIQNSRDFAPGMQIPLGFWNPDRLQWEHAGVGTVDESGQWLVMHVLHFSIYDCNDPIAPPAIIGGPGSSDNPGDGNPQDDTQPPEECSAGSEGCFIDAQSGQVRDAVRLPAVNVMGQTVAPELGYSTGRANPSEVIDLQLDANFDPAIVTVKGYIQFELYIEGQKTDRFTFAAGLDGDGEVGRYRYYWNGRNMLGERLPPGVYGYAVHLSIPYIGKYCYVLNGRFGNPPDCERGYISTSNTTRDFWVYGTVQLNTQTDSPLGSGWELSGQQRLFEDEAGRIVVTDDHQLNEYYFALADQLGGLNPYDLEQPRIAGPAAALPIPGAPAGGTIVGGTLLTNTVWSAASSPYIIAEQDLVVPAGITLTIEPGVEVLLDQYRSLVVTDTDATLWAVGTPTQPITFTAYYQGSYRYWQQYPLNSGSYPLQVEAIASDAAGFLWFGTSYNTGESVDAEVMRLSPDRTTWTAIPVDSGPEMKPSHIRALAFDDFGQKWFATDQGLLMLAADNATWTVYNTGNSGLLSTDVQDLAVDANNNVWAGTDQGISQRAYDGTWTSYDTSNSGLTANAIADITLPEASDEIWFGTDNGLSILTASGDWITYTQDNSDILGGRLADITFDDAGNAWMAVYGGGVSVWLTSGAWISYTAANSALADPWLTAIAIDRLGGTWVGHDWNGVSLLASGGSAWTHFVKPQLGAEGMSDILALPNGEVWFANMQGGAARSYYTSEQDGVISGGHWGTVRLGYDLSSGWVNTRSRLSYVSMELGGVGNQPMLSLVNTAPHLDHLTLRGSGGDGLYSFNGDGLLLDTARIESNAGSGIHLAGDYGYHTLSAVTSQHNSQHGVMLEWNANTTITDCLFLDNDGYGIFVGRADATLDLRGNTVQENGTAARLPANTLLVDNAWLGNDHQHIEWLGGTLFHDATWDGGELGTYWLLGDLTLGGGMTLTVTGGARVLLGKDTSLIADGKLVVRGEAGQPVVFERLQPEEAWNQMRINTDADLRYALIRGGTYGLYISESAPRLDSLGLNDNAYGMYVDSSQVVTVTHSNFYGNQMGLENIGTAAVYARGCFWGTTDGPFSVWDNPEGHGDPAGPGVDFIPWEKRPTFIGGSSYVLDNRTPSDFARLTYDIRTQRYTRIMADGREIHFDEQGRHAYTLEPNGLKTLYTYNPDGTTATLGIALPGEEAPTWVWQFVYAQGKLEYILDPAGRRTDVHIDRNGQLAGVSFPDESQILFYYDSRGLLTQRVDANGSITGYEYDAYGRLSKHIGPARPVYDPQTGETHVSPEVRAYTPSDTGYPLINASSQGSSATPAPAVPLSADLLEVIAYGRGGRSGLTDRWGGWLRETDGEGNTLLFTRSATGQATRVTYPDGSCADYAYDAFGRVLHQSLKSSAQCALPENLQTLAEAETWSYTYEPRFGKVKTAVDPMGHLTTYVYDYELGRGQAGLLLRLELPSVSDELGQPADPVITYAYNAWGQVEAMTNTLGTVTRYVYTQGTPDEASNGSNPLFAPGVTPLPGLLTQVIQDAGGENLTAIYKDFDAAGQVGRTIQPGGRENTTYVYDLFGHVLQATDALGVSTRYGYDGRGNLVRKIVDYTPDGAGGRNLVTEYAYNAEGKLVYQRTAGDGLVQERFYGYDLNGQRAFESDGAGHTTFYGYDNADRQVSITDPAGYTTRQTYTPDGRLERRIDANGVVTRYTYDAAGRVSEYVQDENGHPLVTTSTYDRNGNTLSTTGPGGEKACYQYDARNRLVAATRDCGPGHLNLATTYRYNLGGQLVYQTDPRGVTTYTQRDALGRVTLVRRDQGGLNLEAHTTYDAAGKPFEITDERGVVTRMAYDPLNRLSQRCVDPSGLNLCTSYQYDSLGNQTLVTDPGGIVTRQVYNAFGKPVTLLRDVGGLNVTTSYTYDNDLNLASLVDDNGNQTRYRYTPRGEVASVAYADGTVAQYRYDGAGNLTGVVNPDGSAIALAYDGTRRLTGRSFSAGGWQAFTYDEAGHLASASQEMNGHTTRNTYAYNLLGDVISTTQRLDGVSWTTTTSYDYPAGSHTLTYPSGVQRIYENDPLDRLEAVRAGDQGLIAAYGYHDGESYLTLENANGLVNRVDYDAARRVTRVSSALADYRYGYDAAGNVLYRQRWQAPGHPADVYAYDGLGQVTQVWYGADATDPAAISAYDHLQEYDLDNVGNRLAVENDGEVQPYLPNDGQESTDPMNRYAQVGAAALRYDLRGNLLSDGTNGYVYDAINRLAGVTGPQGQSEYVYDAQGHRVARLGAGGPTYFVYNGSQVIEEYGAGGELEARYTYGRYVDEVLTMERGGNTYTYQRDALGNVTEISDAAGTLVERYDYDIFGKPAFWDAAGNPLPASAIGNAFLFTGRYYDAESGTYHYRARAYHPLLGRFLQPDPAGYGDGPNLYTYVQNRPTSSVDPSGLLSFQLSGGFKTNVFLWISPPFSVQLELGASGSCYQCCDKATKAVQTWANVSFDVSLSFVVGVYLKAPEVMEDISELLKYTPFGRVDVSGLGECPEKDECGGSLEGFLKASAAIGIGVEAGFTFPITPYKNTNGIEGYLRDVWESFSAGVELPWETGEWAVGAELKAGITGSYSCTARVDHLLKFY